MAPLIITDISRWEDNPDTAQKIDFVKMKAAGAVGCIFKASQGIYTDPVFASSWADAKAAGLLRGAYHFLDWGKTAIEQANHFLSVITLDPPDFPPIVDYECDPFPPDAIVRLQQFVSRVEEVTKRIPMIYCGVGSWDPYGSKDLVWARYPLWVANYYVASPKIPLPWTSYVLWQYTPKGDGHLYGCEAMSVDLNYYQGTLAQLKQFCGIVPPPVYKQYVTILPATIRSGPGATDTKIGILPSGVAVLVEQVSGARSKIVSPVIGWLLTSRLSLGEFTELY